MLRRTLVRAVCAILAVVVSTPIGAARDLHHACAALLIAQGAHPKAIMERLGHSSIEVTLDR